MANISFQSRAQATAEFIEKHRDLLSFGTADNAVEGVWIERAEKFLGRPFTKSYKWFLDSYRGGEISGDEIYSVYGEPFETVVGGDIVYHHIIDKKNSAVEPWQLSISATDYGELFFFDYSRFDGAEAPICMSMGKHVTDYATDFFEFLVKRINAYLY